MIRTEITRADYERIVSRLREAGLKISESSQPISGGTLFTAGYDALEPTHEEARRLFDIAFACGAKFSLSAWGSVWVSVQLTEAKCSRCDCATREVAP